MSVSPYKLNVSEPHTINLMVLSAFASMGAVLMTPALPDIAAFFHVTSGLAQLTVSVFLLGYALGQLFYGPIANRFGRKPALYTGILIATIGSLFSILASPIESFPLLILGRFLEALGSSAGLVICFTIINDFYYPEQSRKIVAFLMLAFAIVPGIATAIGGALITYFHWQACFYFLLGYGLILIFPAINLPETIIQHDPYALHSHYLFGKYFDMLRNRGLMAYSILFGLSTACAYLFCAEGPFIGMHVLKLPPKLYGLLGLLPFLGSVLGSTLIIAFNKRFSIKKTMSIGFALEFGAAVLMFLCFSLQWINLYTLLIPMFFLLIGHSLIASNSATIAMSKTSDKANGSAVMNFVEMATATTATFVLGILHAAHAIILPTLFLLALAMMGLVVFFGVKSTTTSLADAAPTPLNESLSSLTPLE